MICDTVINTQTHTHTQAERLYYKLSQLS